MKKIIRRTSYSFSKSAQKRELDARAKRYGIPPEPNLFTPRIVKVTAEWKAGHYSAWVFIGLMTDGTRRQLTTHEAVAWRTNGGVVTYNGVPITQTEIPDTIPDTIYENVS